MAQLKVKKVRMTSTLLRRLFKAPSLETFAQSNAELLHMPQFHTYISELCVQVSEVPEQIIKRSAIDRTYGHQLFNGTRRPSREKAIQLAFGFELDVEGAQQLLKIAQKSALYPQILRDAAILRCLNDHKDIIETQSVLQAMNMTLLGGEGKNE